MSQRIALVLEFDGHAFSGWQRQRNAPSVQQALEQALARIEGHSVATVAAGRTDAGVHAEALLVHVDVSASRWLRSPRAYVHGVNALLPATIRVLGARAVAADFHARFDCLERAYRYQIWNRQTVSALHRWQHWWMPRPLNLDLMREAARYCLGRQDFSALRASGCQARHPVREVREVVITRSGCCICIEVRADAFLYHMVRNLVGNLVEVGLGKRTPEDFAHLLKGRNRAAGAATAPAQGLFFTDARYADFRARDLVLGQSPAESAYATPSG
ncbi:MAG: tRNA pseudouridine(38-40) synthase TruA [Zetaproteobacteria bacterium]|nr:MAG: tRNA pseudouridine(38-40) synthase TruA [Zetaproteobacteria bacterium]